MNDPGLPASRFRPDRLTDCRQLAKPRRWRGLGDTAREGEEARGPAPLRLRLPAPSLEGWDCLALSARNLGEEALLAGLYLWHGAPGSVPMAFSGGRALLPPGRTTILVFARRDFGTYGPAGLWSRVKSLELVVAKEKGGQPGQAAIHLGELWGWKLSTPRGPRLSPSGLADLLLPGAEPVRAQHGLDHPGLRVPPPHMLPRSSADELLAGQVLGERIGWPWDWEADPRQALEWRHFLHRHHDLRTLAQAWAESGRREHLRGLRRLLRDWIHKHPVPAPGNGGAGPAWETLSAAWRVLEWLWIRELAWGDLGPELRGLMRRSLWEHARHLVDHQGHPNNWSLIEAAALALAGLEWTELAEAGAWRGLGLRRLAFHCRRQFNSDGSHCELSPLYQALCLQALLQTRRACLAKSWPWPRPAESALIRGLDYLAALVRPDFSWPALNDSGGVNGDYSALFAWAGQDLGNDLDRPAWLWLGSHGRRGAPPSPGPRRLRQAGLVVLRGDRPDAEHWLLLRAGPPGLAHAHEDGLALEVFASTPRVVDPGISAYAPGPLTAMYRRAAAHSQPLLDGQGVRPDPALTRLERRPGELLAMAQGTAAAGAMVSRQVSWVRGRYWLVWDQAWGLDGEHLLQVGWQLFPGRWRWLRRARAIRAGDGFELRLLYASADSDFDLAVGRRRTPRGWVCLDGQDTPSPHWRLRVHGALPLRALWLLAPQKGYQAVELAASPGKEGVVIRGPGGEVDRWEPRTRAGQSPAAGDPGHIWRKSCP